MPAGATPVVGDALDAATFAHAIPRGATLVHLVGTPHPNPSKAAEFERVDLASIRATAAAAASAGAAHIVYVSVARPGAAHALVHRRARAAAKRPSRPPASRTRSCGPGTSWVPGTTGLTLCVPLYALARMFPPTREQAARLGLVTLDQMVAALVAAVETPPSE